MDGGNTTEITSLLSLLLAGVGVVITKPAGGGDICNDDGGDKTLPIPPIEREFLRLPLGDVDGDVRGEVGGDSSEAVLVVASLWLLPPDVLLCV